MKTLRKVLSVALASSVITSVFAMSITASAVKSKPAQNETTSASGEFKLVAEKKSSNEIDVSFIALEALDFGGIGFVQNYDSKTTFNKNTGITHYGIFDASSSYNDSNKKMGLTSTGKDVSAGDTFLTLKYNTTSSVAADVDYVFEYAFDTAFPKDVEADDYSWGSETITVTYREDTYYDVIFDTDGGSAVASKEVKTGEKITGVSAPTKTGYVFSTWKDGETAVDLGEYIVTKDVTLKAEWAENKHTVTFKPQNDESDITSEVLDGKTVSAITDPVKTGSTFSYWSTSENGTAYDFSTPVTDDLTLYAVYGVNTYTVEFINNGTVIDTKTVAYNNTVAEPATTPTFGTNTFKHWSTAANGTTAYDFNTLVTGDLKLYAVYDKATVDIDKTVDLSDISLTKIVNAADSVSVNKANKEFTFKFTPAPDATYTLTGNAFTVTAKVTDDIAKTVTTKLPETGVQFDKAGVYRYEVEEQNDNTAHWTFDSNKYYMYVTVEEQTIGSELKYICTSTVITTDPANADETKKTSLIFNNEYTPATTLSVSKTVTGNPANIDNKEFTFNITFTAPNVSGTVTLNETEIAYDAPYQFTLKNGEDIEFTLPAGTAYSITEVGEEYYTGSAVITEGTNTKTAAGAYAEDLTVNGTAVELDSEDTNSKNKADFTNEYSITPPTGLNFSNEMLVMMGLALAAVVGGVVISRKVKKARE